MKNIVYILAFCFLLQTDLLIAQETSIAKDSIDSKYREDQFYFGITYNLLKNMPSNMTQNGFSSGFSLGFIRDMPLNDQRNVAIGLGLGYSTNSINQNLLITQNNQNIYNYSLVENGSFSKNKITIHVLEIPLEFRWRTSTPDDYSFWRIYGGIKFGYIIAAKAKYNGPPSDVKVSILDAVEKLQYGFTLSVGYDKINAHLYYGLNSLLNNKQELNNQVLEFSIIKIGLVLYIL